MGAPRIAGINAAINAVFDVRSILGRRPPSPSSLRSPLHRPYAARTKRVSTKDCARVSEAGLILEVVGVVQRGVEVVEGVGARPSMFTSFTLARRRRLTKCRKFQERRTSCRLTTAAATCTASLSMVAVNTPSRSLIAAAIARRPLHDTRQRRERGILAIDRASSSLRVGPVLYLR